MFAMILNELKLLKLWLSKESSYFSATYPKINLKLIFCFFCRHQFQQRMHTINSLEFMTVSVLTLSVHLSSSRSQSAFCLFKCCQKKTSNIWPGTSCCEVRLDGGNYIHSTWLVNSQPAQRAHQSLWLQKKKGSQIYWTSHTPFFRIPETLIILISLATTLQYAPSTMASKWEVWILSNCWKALHIAFKDLCF